MDILRLVVAGLLAVGYGSDGAVEVYSPKITPSKDVPAHGTWLVYPKPCYPQVPVGGVVTDQAHYLIKGHKDFCWMRIDGYQITFESLGDPAACNGSVTPVVPNDSYFKAVSALQLADIGLNKPGSIYAMKAVGLKMPKRAVCSYEGPEFRVDDLKYAIVHSYKVTVGENVGTKSLASAAVFSRELPVGVCRGVRVILRPIGGGLETRFELSFTAKLLEVGLISGPLGKTIANGCDYDDLWPAHGEMQMGEHVKQLALLADGGGSVSALHWGSVVLDKTDDSGGEFCGRLVGKLCIGDESNCVRAPSCLPTKQGEGPPICPLVFYVQ